MKENIPTIKASDEDKKLVGLLAEGMKGNQIAKKIKVNENTLAFNLSVLRKKFGCKNSLSLVVYFFRNKLIE
jgi:DNA-binding NarL/FixJ family response regulator